jgi:hypothetical protein
MSNNTPPPQRPQEVVELKSDPARDTDLTPQNLNQQAESQKLAQMAAAGLLAAQAVQILKSDHESRASSGTPLAATSGTPLIAPIAPPTSGPALLMARIFGMAFLLVIGLGSIAGMIAIIIAMLR